MKLTYHDENGYLIPDLIAPDSPAVGVWGMRHLRYIKQHKKVRYTNLLTTGKLNAYLAEIDRRAQNMKAVLVKQMSEHEGTNEMLKERNQIEWVRKMNNIRNRAEEIVKKEIIFN